jgi:hypothetical protein
MPSDPIGHHTRDPQADDAARDRQDQAHAVRGMNQRAVITLAVGVLLAAGLAGIWRWIP